MGYLSEPMMMPTRGPAAPSPSPAVATPSPRGATRAARSASESAVTVRWAILRPARLSALPYQWMPGGGDEGEGGEAGIRRRAKMGAHTRPGEGVDRLLDRGLDRGLDKGLR